MYLETLKEYDYENDVLIWTVIEVVEDGKNLSFRPINVINKKKINNSFIVTYTRKEYLNPQKSVNKYLESPKSIKSYINLHSIATYVDRIESYKYQNMLNDAISCAKVYQSQSIEITQF